MHKVFIRTDADRRVTAINSDAFLPETEGWMQIDEGVGDRYHHAQGNYLPRSLLTDEGIPRYVLVDGKVQERSAEDIAADIAAIPPPPPDPMRVVFRALAQTDVIEPADALDNAGMFPLWADCIGQRAEAGSYWRHADKLYRVNVGQGHTIQADWAPDKAVSLFSLAANPADEWPEWIQPTGAHDAYEVGAKVTDEGKRWINEHPSNGYKPGVYGWKEIKV